MDGGGWAGCKVGKQRAPWQCPRVSVCNVIPCPPSSPSPPSWPVRFMILKMAITSAGSRPWGHAEIFPPRPHFLRSLVRPPQDGSSSQPRNNLKSATSLKSVQARVRSWRKCEKTWGGGNDGNFTGTLSKHPQCFRNNSESCWVKISVGTRI